MKERSLVLAITAAILFAAPLAAQDYVTRAEFNELKQQVAELASLQRETLLAIRGLARPTSMPLQYVSMAQEPKVTAIETDPFGGAGIGLTGKVEIRTYGNSRIELPIGDTGYLASGTGSSHGTSSAVARGYSGTALRPTSYSYPSSGYYSPYGGF
jgi:hypothetical protein